ncbi:MAG: hypothetical protein ABW006_06475 [Hyphomicrobium sp.]|jgi:hypothetical protein
MQSKPIELIYTILSHDEPVAAVKTTRTQARKLCDEEWFLEELSLLKSNGVPLYSPGTRLRARPAIDDEWLRYDEGAKEAGEVEDMLFVYLVVIDGN